jgi:hypothetical protein
MNEKTVGEILVKAIAKMAQQEQLNDESWKKEAIVALDERIAAYNKLEWLSIQQRPLLN